MKADGTDQRQLSSEGHRDAFPSWSPDSRRIAFQNYRREGDGIIGEVYVIDVKDGKRKKLLDKKYSVGDPAWSPDGTRIAVRTGAGGEWGIDVVDVQTRKRTRCVHSGSAFFWYDAERLVFEADKDGNREIFAVKIGDQPVNLTNSPASDRLPRFVGRHRFGE